MVTRIRPNQAHAERRRPVWLPIFTVGTTRFLKQSIAWLLSQAEASASERALARMETGEMPGNHYVRSSSTVLLLSLIYTTVL